MRKFLCVALLLLLSFQSGWAAAASYCEHRGVAHEPHFGHHDEHHHSSPEQASDSGTGGAEDGDATHCHGHVSAMLLTSPVLPEPVATQLSMHSARIDWRGPVPAPPERPQWVRHA
ncbi:MAG: hypothetical protein C0505_18590 [Leptothrix sp. (in: Bacteria)]|nr:hypothetical protein [Leptothrix sp. (in: b-proteobacteria)]